MLGSLNDVSDFSFPCGLRLAASLVGSRNSPDLSFSPAPWRSGSLPDTSSTAELLNEMQMKSPMQHYFTVVVSDGSIQRHHERNYVRHCTDNKESAGIVQVQFPSAMSLQSSGRGRT